MPGESEEGGILLANVVKDADGGGAVGGEADDVASGAAELSLQGLHAAGRRVEVLFEKFLEDVHWGLNRSISQWSVGGGQWPDNDLLKTSGRI
jgi:hypothetical protein